MSALVVDASVVADLLRDAPRTEALSWRIQQERRRLHAPALCDIEVVSAIRGLVRGGHVTDTEAAGLLGAYLTMPIEIHPQTALLPRVFELRDRLSPYAAVYLALAEALEAPLATADAALAAATRDAGVEVLA